MEYIMKLEQCLAHRSHWVNICWINTSALLHILSHLLLMTILRYEPSKYHCSQYKDEEIKVQGGYDLPKIINLRFCGAKSTTGPTSQPSLVADTHSACKEANLWAIRSAKFVGSWSGSLSYCLLTGTQWFLFYQQSFHEVRLGSLDLYLGTLGI